MRVGVLGAGQLGRMLALSGYPLGLEFRFVDPSPQAPASKLGDHIVADYEDPDALKRLAECDVVTFEFESVPVKAARKLAETVRIHPPADALGIAQDRLYEKTSFRELGIATAEFARVDDEASFRTALAQIGLPAVLKTRRLGYDGKGQQIIREEKDADTAFAALSGVPLILEAFVSFRRELSVIAVRGRDKDTRFYPVIENEHDAGILSLSRAPARDLDERIRREAEDYATRLLDRFDYVGVLALELFDLEGRLYANEIAPRVHNSGHWTIEGARTSQFENHLRAILGLPLGSTEALGPAAMLNLIGKVPDPARVLDVVDAHLHDYAKEPRARRKVGHVTVRAPDAAILEERIQTLKTLLL